MPPVSDYIIVIVVITGNYSLEHNAAPGRMTIVSEGDK